MSTRLALVLTFIVVLFAAGCGDEDEETASVSTTTTTATETTDESSAPPEGTEPSEAEEADARVVEELREEVSALSEESSKSEAKPAESSASAGYSGATNCGAGVYVRTANTSCAFALNVASDFHSTPSYRFYSYSPVTGQTYRVRCTPTWPSLCKAGSGARILITR